MEGVPVLISRAGVSPCRAGAGRDALGQAQKAQRKALHLLNLKNKLKPSLTFCKQAHNTQKPPTFRQPRLHSLSTQVTTPGASEALNQQPQPPALPPSTMADARRRTLATSGSQGTGIPIPSSIARPSHTLRQSLAPGMGGGGMGASAGRQSLAPGRAANNRASVAGYAPGSSQETFGASQGSQPFSQQHGGPGGREPPSTLGRNSLYNSHALGGSMSVSRGGTLKSGQVLEYAPPR